MNRFKSTSKSKKRKDTQPVKSTPMAKRIKHHSTSSESDGSMCSCGTCGGSDHEGDSKPSRHMNILNEIKKILEENKALRLENKKLKEELRESFNVKQLAQDLRQLSNTLQKNPGGPLLTPISRPASTGSAASSTALHINGSTRKPTKTLKPKVDDSFIGQETEDIEDMEQEELCTDSGIILPSSRIQTALENAQSNYRLFTRSLMEMIFTKETMAASSVRGQKSQAGSDNTRPALDQNAVKAIVDRVTQEFQDIPSTLVMGVIRQKIADVRKRLKIQTNRELSQASQESLSMV